MHHFPMRFILRDASLTEFPVMRTSQSTLPQSKMVTMSQGDMTWWALLPTSLLWVTEVSLWGVGCSARAGHGLCVLHPASHLDLHALRSPLLCALPQCPSPDVWVPQTARIPAWPCFLLGLDLGMWESSGGGPDICLQGWTLNFDTACHLLCGCSHPASAQPSDPLGSSFHLAWP